MLVVNKGHSNTVITDYNGKRYVFHKDQPVDILPEIYNNIVLSRHIDASEIIPVEAEKESTVPSYEPPKKEDRAKPVPVRGRGRPRK